MQYLSSDADSPATNSAAFDEAVARAVRSFTTGANNTYEKALDYIIYRAEYVATVLSGIVKLGPEKYGQRSFDKVQGYLKFYNANLQAFFKVFAKQLPTKEEMASDAKYMRLEAAAKKIASAMSVIQRWTVQEGPGESVTTAGVITSTFDPYHIVVDGKVVDAGPLYDRFSVTPDNGTPEKELPIATLAVAALATVAAFLALK